MSLGKVIRKYRKIGNLTQEEMARRLGVTASAVNKWENEASCPDITLLAPIARLLNISTDTLLSFREALTAEEIGALTREADLRLKRDSYDEAFRWAKRTLDQYPSCERLIMNFAVIFDAQRVIQGISEEEYDEYLRSLYVRALDSGDEAIRVCAADSLVGFYMRQGQYGEAEKYLEYFSAQNPERKRKQAQIYAETGRTEEAYRAYEELLFADFQRAYAELQSMYTIALKLGDTARACRLSDKKRELARCFEMGRYYEALEALDLAVLERDADAAVCAMEELLACAGRLGDFKSAPLYEHMHFKEPVEDFAAQLRETLLDSFRDDERYGFLKDNDGYRRLTARQFPR